MRGGLTPPYPDAFWKAIDRPPYCWINSIVSQSRQKRDGVAVWLDPGTQPPGICPVPHPPTALRLPGAPEPRRVQTGRAHVPAVLANSTPPRPHWEAPAVGGLLCSLCSQGHHPLGHHGQLQSGNCLLGEETGGPRERGGPPSPSWLGVMCEAGDVGLGQGLGL